MIAPDDSHISGYITNRFFPRGEFFICSPDPQISSSEADWGNWFQIPRFNTLGIDQDQVYQTTTNFIQHIAKFCIANKKFVTKLLIFPNLSYNHRFFTVSYDSLLETYSANVVVPMAVYGGLCEYQVASPRMDIILMKDEMSGFESDISNSSLAASLKRFQKLDETGISHGNTVRAFSFKRQMDDNWIDDFCEHYLEDVGGEINSKNQKVAHA